jgi:transposase
MLDIKSLPDDSLKLKDMLLDLFRKNNQHKNQIEYLQEENRYFRDKLFGRKSEKKRPDNDPNQPSLFDEAEEVTAEENADQQVTQVKTYSRKKGGRRKLPESLPRIDIIHDIPEKDKECACGSEMEKIGEEVSEKLLYIPATVEVERHIRYKYACKNCEGAESEGIHPTVKIAPPAPAIIPKSIATAGLLAYILVSKFEDALPFYRQEKLFSRIGIDLLRATMCRWAIKVHEKCKPLLELMQQHLLSGPLVGIDETTVQVLGEIGKENTTKSYMWVARGGPPGKTVLWFHYDPGRSSQVAKEILKDYRGAVQTDGYSGYNFLEIRNEGSHAGCWAHVRRKFYEVTRVSKKTISANMAIDKIQKLYLVEKEFRDNKLSPEEIKQLRQEKSKPLVEDFFSWLEKKTLDINPQSKMGKAVAYTLKLKKKLLEYLDDGNIFIDNNLVENAIRPFVIGRKNWLFSGSPNGAHASAGIYSLIETAKAADLDPYWCLRYIFEMIPVTTGKDFEKLLPYNISKDTLYEHFRGRM